VPGISRLFCPRRYNFAESKLDATACAWLAAEAVQKAIVDKPATIVHAFADSGVLPLSLPNLLASLKAETGKEIDVTPSGSVPVISVTAPPAEPTMTVHIGDVLEFPVSAPPADQRKFLRAYLESKTPEESKLLDAAVATAFRAEMHDELVVPHLAYWKRHEAARKEKADLNVPKQKFVNGVFLTSAEYLAAKDEKPRRKPKAKPSVPVKHSELVRQPGLPATGILAAPPVAPYVPQVHPEMRPVVPPVASPAPKTPARATRSKKSHVLESSCNAMEDRRDKYTKRAKSNTNTVSEGT